MQLRVTNVKSGLTVKNFPQNSRPVIKIILINKSITDLFIFRFFSGNSIDFNHYLPR